MNLLTVETLIDIFDKYGWLGILGIIVCILLFIFIHYLTYKISKNVSNGLEKVGEKLTEQISRQNDSLTKVIIGQQEKMLNHLFDEKQAAQERHNDMVIDKEDLAVDVNNYLRDIMNIHDSQRAYILEFHNHNENLSGVPFVKFSCKYEWFSAGYDPLLSICKDMPFGSLAQIVRDIKHTDSQCILYTDLKKFRAENPSICHYIKNDMTKAFLFKAMYDKNNILIALLVLEYNYDIKPEDINFYKLDVQAAELTQLINLRYKYS